MQVDQESSADAGGGGSPPPWMDLLEFCWQIGAYIDAAERLMAETQTDNTVERLLEEAHRQLDLMRNKIEALYAEVQS